MFDVSQLPPVARQLWEASAVASGGRQIVQISVGPDELTITRMAILEVIFSDDPPTRDDIKQWVIATAQRLGFNCTELTLDGSEKDPGRMEIDVAIDGLRVRIHGFWGEFPEAGDPSNPQLRLVSSGGD